MSRRRRLSKQQQKKNILGEGEFRHQQSRNIAQVPIVSFCLFVRSGNGTESENKNIGGRDPALDLARVQHHSLACNNKNSGFLMIV